MATINLTQEELDRLTIERKDLYKRNNVGRSWVTLVNKEGTRYLTAFRCDGGGWRVRYGKVLLMHDGSKCYWRKSLKNVFSKAANGVDIPQYVRIKKDVVELAKAIGIFGI